MYTSVIESIDIERLRRVNSLTNKSPSTLNSWQEALKTYPEEKKAKIQFAFDYGTNIRYNHSGISSELYFLHPIRIATYAAFFSKSKIKNYPILGLLHNIFELTKINKSEIESYFGNTIKEDIETLTVNRKYQWDHQYKKEYYQRIKERSHPCRVVKVLDKFDNLFLLHINPDIDIKKKYLNEIEEYILPMITDNLPELEDYFNELVINTKILSTI